MAILRFPRPVYDVARVHREMMAHLWDCTDLAAAAGLNVDTVRDFFNKEQATTTKTVAKIVKALGLRPADVVLPSVELTSPISKGERISE
jgi:DNA-binding Xre family transcriptional regulator